MDIRIGYFDSGVGGLNYLEAVRTQLAQPPFANTADKPSIAYTLYYLADTAAFPYGDKSEGYLRQRILQMAEKFINAYSLDMVVLACNTASLLCIDSLRKSLPQKFVGVVPAIKPAVELRVPKIYVMNTSAAGNSYYAKDMAAHSKEKYGYDSKVFLRPCQDLVDAIEMMVCSNKEAYHAHAVVELSRIIEEIRELDCLAVVLGCTHFLHVKKELQRLLPNIYIIDSLEGVSKRSIVLIKTIVEERTHNELAGREANTVENEPLSINNGTNTNTITSYLLLSDDSKREQYAYVSTVYNMEYLGVV